ncbi:MULTISPECIES: hypothetical protein [unclassified Neptuniibacter]|uniref:hypothetical protein n=1 Tax=unclassified Neptuniibacter TaxID=2630693 RepID=UPI000C57B081|nr:MULTISPECIES: hypothetical protein [unclassified Neptuniibacter]MAY42611.1 hypothetical protein [Oceanospirillaceae bacterium]|tara:strand:- start:1476 stop:1826 length:351 start_codon:yes stop_codon:yes gene_type:complete
MNINLSAWGKNPPEFIRVLASVVDQSGSKKAAADRLGVDRASVSTLLANKYPANTTAMEQKIMAFNQAHECPILGEIDSKLCQKNRQQPFISSNPQRVALYRACRQCKYNPNRGEA